MIIKINSQKLLTALQTVQKAVSTNNIIPALSGYLFDIGNTDIRIIGNNMETQISTKVECEADNIGLFIVPQTLIALLKGLPNQGITITIAELLLTVTYAGGTAEMPVEDGGDFPTLECKTKDTMVINGGELSAALNQVVFAASNNELQTIRYINVIADKTGLLFEAIDGNVCARYKVDSETGVERSLLLTKNQCGFLTDLSGAVSVIIDVNKISFITELATTTCVLGNEKYPDISQIIPKDNPIKATVETVSLRNAVKRVMGFGEKFNYGITLEFGDALQIKASDKTLNTKANESLPCKSEPITIAFNSQNLLNLLTHISDDTVTFEMSNEKTAAIIQTSDTFFLLMPQWAV